MKLNILTLAFISVVSFAWSQENMLSLSGGYAFANIEDFSEQATGWRINGTYDFNPQSGKFAHGLVIGYSSIQASDKSGVIETTGTISSLPVFYAPKLFFGESNVKLFVKGALGTQFAWLKREGAIVLTDNDVGFYTGGGAGLKIDLGEKLFINAEYEIAWVSNSFYDNGWLNNALFGIGFKF